MHSSVGTSLLAKVVSDTEYVLVSFASRLAPTVLGHPLQLVELTVGAAVA